MNNQNHENVNEHSEKLTTADFFKELNDLLKKAPKEVVLFVNATEDPENGKDHGQAIYALQGNKKHISFGLVNSFRHDERIKDVVFTSVEIKKMMEGSPFDILEKMAGFFRK